MASRHSTAPLGEPGVLRMRAWPRVPAVARDSRPSGDTSRMASARPGAGRSRITSVPSGVRSRGPKPVPPVVTTSPAKPSASSTSASPTTSRPSATTRGRRPRSPRCAAARRGRDPRRRPACRRPPRRTRSAPWPADHGRPGRARREISAAERAKPLARCHRMPSARREACRPEGTAAAAAARTCRRCRRPGAAAAARGRAPRGGRGQRALRSPRVELGMRLGQPVVDPGRLRRGQGAHAVDELAAGADERRRRRPAARAAASTRRSTSSAWMRQRASARRRSDPSPEHGASTSTRSARAGGQRRAARRRRRRSACAVAPRAAGVRRDQAGPGRMQLDGDDRSRPAPAMPVALPPGPAHRSTHDARPGRRRPTSVTHCEARSWW